MKPDSSQGVQADSSTTRMYTNVDEVNSKGQTMDSASDCKFIYSTPQVWKTGSDNRGSATMTVRSSYSVDSGISDTFNSTWTSSNDISSLSAECSPESETANKRLAVKACECSCSPIKRVSSTSIQGRRLTFTESDFQARKFSVLEVNTSEREAAGFREKYVTSDGVDDLAGAQADLSPTSKSVVCNYHDQSCVSSPDSVIDDDLEVGIQDMALGELSPHVDCTTSMNLKSANCDGGVQTCCFHEEKHMQDSALIKGLFFQHMSDSCKDMSVEKTSISKSSQTKTSLLKCSPYWAYRKSKSSDFCNPQALHNRTDANRKFHNKLSLASPQKPPTPGHVHRSPQKPPTPGHVHRSPQKPPTPGHAASEQAIQNTELIQTSVNFTVPSLPMQQYTWPWSIANRPGHGDSNMTSNYDHHNSFIHNSAQNVHASKRSSDCTEVHSFPLCPPKVRRTHMFIKEERAPVVKIHTKCASGKILDKKDSSVLDCGTQNVDYLHLYNSASSRSVNRRQIEEANSTCGKLEKPDIIGYDSFYGNNSEDVKKEGVLDNFNNGDSEKRCLQELKELHSSQDPSRLIGRNVGVGKFDIVCELYLQNLHICLEAIFCNLADSDLASIVAVSTRWKDAIYNEHKAYHRYRQHQKSLSTRNCQHVHGKENTGEKPGNASSSLTLTQPRGLLSSMQSQAKVRAAPEAPTPVSIKDVLMCDDTLRVCPHCQGPAMVKPCQDRAVCMSNKCAYDFCSLCFSRFHHPRPCKPLCKAPSRAGLAGTKTSKKNLKRL